MYGGTAGAALPPAATGGALAATGQTGLGVTVAIAMGLLLAGVVLVRRGLLAAGRRTTEEKSDQR